MKYVLVPFWCENQRGGPPSIIVYTLKFLIQGTDGRKLDKDIRAGNDLTTQD